MATIEGSAIDEVLERGVGSGAVAGVTAVAADREGMVYSGAAGPRVAGTDEPLTVDTHYRLASMTKTMTTVAALQLVERGALDLDAPVERYCPTFRQVQVLTGFDGDTPLLRAPASRATIRQLVTHATGLGYWFFAPELARWEEVTGTPNVFSGSDIVFTAPMLADPGTTFQYGISTDWLGLVVEAVSGETLDVAIRDGITGPLAMDSTLFRLSPQALSAAVPIHMRGPNGQWAPSPMELPQEPDHWFGGHGLHSTPTEYLRFQRALLRWGELDGTRILREDTVAAAFTNQIGDLDFPAAIPSGDPAITRPFTIGPDHKWGYGLLLNTNDVPGMRRAGSGAWMGALNTYFWIDPTTGIAGAIYSQSLPFLTDEAVTIYADFERALYAAL